MIEDMMLNFNKDLAFEIWLLAKPIKDDWLNGKHSRTIITKIWPIYFFLIFGKLILYKKNRNEIVNGIEMKSFLGNCLIIEMRNKYWTKYRFGDMIRYCNDCDQRRVDRIRMVSVLWTLSNICTHFWKQKKGNLKNIIISAVDLILDRSSWCRGTQIEIFSVSLNGWQFGEILQINCDNNTMKVSYLNHETTQNRYLLKTVNKNDTNQE